MSYAASAIVTDIRTVTEKTVAQISDAQLLSLLDSEYQRLRRRVADIAPDLYTTISADFIPTVSGANASQDLQAAPVSIGAGTIHKPLVVEVKDGDSYGAVPLAKSLTSGSAIRLSWRLRGGRYIDFFPAQAVAGQSFRLQYVAKPAATGSSLSTVDVPDGGDAILRERVAVYVRSRLEEQDVHTAKAQELWLELRNSLISQYPATPDTIQDLTGRF